MSEASNTGTEMSEISFDDKAQDDEDEPACSKSTEMTSISGTDESDPTSPTSGIDEIDPTNFNKRSLSDDDRIKLIKIKWNPPNSSYKFPKNHQGRRYNKSWESDYPWLRYSPALDGAFCSVCIAFQDNPGETQRYAEFVTEPFKDWKNATGSERGRLSNHSKSERHQKCLEKTNLLLSVSDQTKPSIVQSISKAYSDKVEKNRAKLLSLIDVIITLAKRNIAFRGSWNKDTSEEDGNFMFFIHWKSNFDKVLKEHLEQERSYGKYLSPMAQNEFIQCCELEIRSQIVTRCNKSDFFSVMADECADCANQAQLSICVRYCYTENDTCFVTEDFCGFVELVKTDAETISTSILNKLREWGFDLTRLRGQGYDGCSTMSGEVSGVKTRIMEEIPQAKYFVHCRSHCLNLVVVNSCQSVVVVRNFMAILGKITWFISASSKRKNIMKSIMKDEGQSDVKFDLIYDQEEGLFSQGKRLLPTLAETRWTSRTDTLTWLLKNYDKVLDILDEIQSQTVGNSDATSYKMTLLSFEIVVVAVVTQFLLGYLRPLSIELQSEKCDLVEAHVQARNLSAVFLEIRENADNAFSSLFARASKIADDNEITISKPRTSGRQRHRANAEAVTVEQHFRINVFLPLIDHIIKHLNDRFPDSIKPMLYGFYLLPCNFQKLTDEVIESITKEYNNDIPHPDDLPQEIHRWKTLSDIQGLGSKCSLDEILKHTQFYPNIKTIFLLLLALPVGSCSCERSFSALRRLKTWNRSTMTEARLCGLSMIHIHRDDSVGKIDPLEVLKRWDSSGHRKIFLAFEKE